MEENFGGKKLWRMDLTAKLMKKLWRIDLATKNFSYTNASMCQQSMR